MPLIGIDTYKIDFNVLENNDPKTLILLDQSHYLGTPEKPVLNIILPGFTGAIQFSYTPNSIITINSDKLDLTGECEYEETADLPDGVYQITMKVCPYDELFAKKCYLKTSTLECMYRNLLLTLDIECSCVDERKFRNQLIDIDLLIQSAKAEVLTCNITKATTKYRSALKLVTSLSNKLNCN